METEKRINVIDHSQSPVKAKGSTAATTTSEVDIRFDVKKFPRLYSYSQEEALKNMSGIIVKTYLYLGRNAPNSKDVKLIAQQVLFEINRDIFGLSLRNITFEEIERAVMKKILEAPDTVFGISVSTFMSAIVEYARTGGTVAANKAIEKEVAAIRKGINEFTETPLVQGLIEDMVGKSLGRCLASNHPCPLPLAYDTGVLNITGKARNIGSGPYIGDSDSGSETPPPESPL